MYSIILGEAGATVMKPPTAKNRSNEVNTTALLAHLVQYRRYLNVSSMDPHAKTVVNSAYNILAGINAHYRIQDSFCVDLPSLFKPMTETLGQLSVRLLRIATPSTP